jgi:hypothetical protein
MMDDGGPRAREFAAGIPAFNAAVALIWARWRRWIVTGAGGLGLVWLLMHHLLFWAATVAALFVWYWFADTPRVRAWLRHAITALRLRLLPPAGVYFVWSSPAQDADHAQARSAFQAVMAQLAALPRDVDGDGRVERRKWLYAATEQADGLMIRGDDPFLAIRTRPLAAASAPVAPMGFVGAAAATGVVSRWRLLVMVALGAAAALLYARGEVLEAGRDAARADAARAEERAQAADRLRQEAEADLGEWINRSQEDVRLVLEENRISREYLAAQEDRRRRLEARRAERERQAAEAVVNPDPVDLTGSLRELAAPAAAAMPEMPPAAPGSDPAGGVSDGEAGSPGF